MFIALGLNSCKTGENTNDNSEKKSEKTEKTTQITYEAVKINSGVNFYAHFESTDGNIADLREMNGNVFLVLGLSEQAEMISLDGSYYKNNEFMVKGVRDENGKQAKYKGRITADYGLEITDENTGKKYTFSQDYVGGIPFEAHGFIYEKDDEPVDEIFLLLPDKKFKNLENAIIDMAFDDKKGEIDTYLTALHNEFTKEAKSAPSGAYWTRQITSDLLLNDKGIVSYAIYSYSFKGGAHGYGEQKFLVYDLENDKKITLKDVFTDAEIEKLPKLMYEKIKTNRGMNDEQMKNEYTLPLKVTDNFYLSPKGITFVYNPYEITSYAMGEDVVFIPYEDLQKDFNSDFIKKFN